MKLGQTGVGTQLTDGFINMAQAMLVGIEIIGLLMLRGIVVTNAASPYARLPTLLAPNNPLERCVSVMA